MGTIITLEEMRTLPTEKHTIIKKWMRQTVRTKLPSIPKEGDAVILQEKELPCGVTLEEINHLLEPEDYSLTRILPSLQQLWLRFRYKALIAQRYRFKINDCFVCSEEI
jgi:hypothetical protein